MKRSLIFLFCLLSLHHILAQDQMKIDSFTIKPEIVKEDPSKEKFLADLSDALNKYNQSIETGESIQKPMNNNWLSNDINNIHLFSPGVYFSLDGGWGSYSGNAAINFNGTDYAYDPVLGGTIIYCSQGTYSYVITPEDVSKAIIRGTVSVTSNNLVNVKIDIADAHRIDIYVKDQNSNALQGAMVKFNGVTLFTDETGLASFDRYPLGTYTYSVSNPGYISLGNQTLEIMAQVEKRVVTLNQLNYAVTFNVRSGNDALAGASITLYGRELTTDVEGLATFKNLVVGTYDYTVAKTGYKEETGNITIADGDAFLKVDLLNISGLGETSVKSVKLYPNPTSGNLSVILPENPGNEVNIRITDLKGTVLFENKIAGSSNQIKLDLSAFDSGLYFVKLIGSGVENTIKVVKN